MILNANFIYEHNATAGLSRKCLQSLQLNGKRFYILFSYINGQFLPSRERHTSAVENISLSTYLIN